MVEDSAVLNIAPTAFTVESELVGVHVLADRSVSIRIRTMAEVDDAELLFLIRRTSQQGWLTWSPRPLEDAEVAQLQGKNWTADGGKSPGARLRGVIAVLWAKKFPTAAQRALNPLEGFYASLLEGLIDRYKTKIDELESGV